MRLLHYIISYLRDDLHVHLPCFWDKTSARLQAVMDREPFLWLALDRIICNLKDDLALQTLVHYLCSPAMQEKPLLNPTDGQPSPNAQSSSDGREWEASDPGNAAGPSHLGSPGAAGLSKIPPFKPLLFKGKIEGTDEWLDLVFFAQDTFRVLPAADAATREELARAVDDLVSYLNVHKLAQTPLFDAMSSNQFVALLEREPHFEAAVRHLRVRASMSGYYDFRKALRVVVNYLCQRRKGAQDPAQRVRIALPETG
ncbi:hypothetical protein AURDEDRAFT_114999 [Auricularia subglabra TFB-10046 SS5]|nr:hypothetical protein AURDEDRAFT_114999 [Auricularia subglabra TFB-10046 SS5]